MMSVMSYREFGIYTINDFICIVINEKDEYLEGFHFLNSKILSITNSNINDWIENNFPQIDEKYIFEISKNNPTLKYFSYLGMIKDDFQKPLKSRFATAKKLQEMKWKNKGI